MVGVRRADGKRSHPGVERAVCQVEPEGLSGGRGAQVGWFRCRVGLEFADQVVAWRPELGQTVTVHLVDDLDRRSTAVCAVGPAGGDGLPSGPSGRPPY